MLQRYYGYYANRTRGERRKAVEAAHVAEGSDEATPTDTELPLIRLIYEVDPLVCPKCGGAMRLIARIQEAKVIDKILRHLRAKGRDTQAGPSATGHGVAGGPEGSRGGVRVRRRTEPAGRAGQPETGGRETGGDSGCTAAVGRRSLAADQAPG